METCQPSIANVTHRRPAAPYYVKGLALGLSAYLIGIHLWTWVLTVPIFLGGGADFRQLYAAGYMARSGHSRQLYDYDSQRRFQNQVVSQTDLALPFIRPAYEAVLFVPLSLLPYRAAYFTWLAINLALLAICYRLLFPKMEDLYHIYRWLPAAIFLGFLPIAAALIQGQDSIFLLTLLTVALVLLERGKEVSAGLLIGLGLFKFQIVIPMALMFLIWRRFRLMAGFAVTASIGTLVSLWVVGFSGFAAYVRALITMGVGLVREPHEVNKPVANLMANLHGLVFGLAGSNLSGFWIVFVTAILSGVVIFTAAISGRTAKRLDHQFLLATTASALVSYYLLIHDMSVLLIPIALTLGRFIEAEATGDRDGRIMARAAALMFVAPICESFMPDHFYVVALPLCGFFFVLAHNNQSTANEAQTSSFLPLKV
jgi:Glycosyltransferase family 87